MKTEAEWQILPRCAVLEGDEVEGVGVISYQSFSMDLRYVAWYMGKEHRERRTDVTAQDGRTLDAWNIWWDEKTGWLDAHEYVRVLGPMRDDRFMGLTYGETNI